MKNKGILIATSIFFLLVNTTQLWEGLMGIFAMVTFLIMIIFYLVLSVILLGPVLKAIKEKFKERNRVYLIAFMTFVLTASFLFPNGLINYGISESESILIAQREGAANCMTTLKLDINNKFIERNVCFGVTETKGDYRIINDTIYFENVTYGRHENEFYEFAVIKDDKKKGKYLGDIVRYRNHSDTTGTPLWITKNELKK